jgi:hypothetical protein
MENQNQPIIVPNPTAEPQMAVDAKNFKNKLKTFNKDIKTKFDSLPKQKQTLVIVAAVLISILIILLLLVALFGKKQTAIVATPSPSPVAITPAPAVILNASKYATDSGVLKIESDLNGFQKQLESANVKQTDLITPNMDFNINFNK